MLQRSFKSLVLVVLSLVVFTTAVYPQQVQNSKSSPNKLSIAYNQYDEKQFANFIANLSVVIQAENSGLRKSAIYLAGLYSLNEVVPTLVSQLEKENNSDIKILIALALYRMEDPIGMEAVEKLYKNESNVRVKRMSKAILDEFKNKLAVTEVSER
ncbi:MAG TPA: hypothetical protein VIH28_04270 [Ignavibacteriaceae bacterium]